MTDNNELLILAVQMDRCKQCSGDCTKCEKYALIIKALKQLSPIDQLEVDNILFRLDKMSAQRQQRIDRLSYEKYRQRVTTYKLIAAAIAVATITLVFCGVV